MATATRGAEKSESGLRVSEEAPAKELLFDLFIFPNIPCPPRNGYFGGSSKLISENRNSSGYLSDTGFSS